MIRLKVEILLKAPQDSGYSGEYEAEFYADKDYFVDDRGCECQPSEYYTIRLNTDKFIRVGDLLVSVDTIESLKIEILEDETTE